MPKRAYGFRDAQNIERPDDSLLGREQHRLGAADSTSGAGPVPSLSRHFPGLMRR
jgi:hypothetical protein